MTLAIRCWSPLVDSCPIVAFPFLLKVVSPHPSEHRPPLRCRGEVGSVNGKLSGFASPALKYLLLRTLLLVWRPQTVLRTAATPRLFTIKAPRTRPLPLPLPSPVSTTSPAISPLLIIQKTWLPLRAFPPRLSLRRPRIPSSVWPEPTRLTTAQARLIWYDCRLRVSGEHVADCSSI